MGEGDPKAQTSSHNINKSRGCNVQHGGYSSYCVAYLKVAKKIDLKSSHHKKKYVL